MYYIKVISLLDSLLTLIHILDDEELGSSEESGKDWSDLEREAAEEDKERGEVFDRGDFGKNKKPSKHSSSSKDRCVNRY